MAYNIWFLDSDQSSRLTSLSLGDKLGGSTTTKKLYLKNVGDVTASNIVIMPEVMWQYQPLIGNQVLNIEVLDTVKLAKYKYAELFFVTATSVKDMFNDQNIEKTIVNDDSTQNKNVINGLGIRFKANSVANDDIAMWPSEAYLWTTMAVDNNGVAGNYAKSIALGALGAGATVPFWIKIAIPKGINSIGNSRIFNLKAKVV